MSGLQTRTEEPINGVDVREHGNALRVATNTPHLVSLGTGRLSTAVTLHPIKQGRVTIGSDPTCDIYVLGTGVASVHCRVENSHGVVTLYPLSGSTLLDGLPVDKPTRLSQGSMLTIGRSNYLRFNHPAEAKLMKSVLPSGHVSMAPIQFHNDEILSSSYPNHKDTQSYQPNLYRDASLTQLDQELDLTIKEMSRKKPPVLPKKPNTDRDSNSDQEGKPKMTGIMAKVSKFEYYAKQQKVGRSQFYTNENEISPKVFSANSLTVNTPAKDVLGEKAIPNYITKNQRNEAGAYANKINQNNAENNSEFNINKTNQIFVENNTADILKHTNAKMVINENNVFDSKSGSYANVTVRNRKIDDIVKNFDLESNKLPKKVNNDQQEHLYGKINVDRKVEEIKEEKSQYKRIERAVIGVCLPSAAYDRNPQYSPVYTTPNSLYDRSAEAENRRAKAYQDRIKEEEQKEAETARLEEILNMCAEYERQISSGIPITPTEKRPHNKIITNGSLPRSVALNNPNFIQTSDGYYKFDTSHTRNNTMSKSIPLQRNLSSYENFDMSTSPEQIEQLTPEVAISSPNTYENVGRMDEIGIPIFDNSVPDVSSPIMIRKAVNQSAEVKMPILASPKGSPYENVYFKNNVYGSLKPKSPNTQSPRTRIKTSFAHKNLPSPQYFVFPSPPPVDNSNKPFNIKSSQNSPKEENIKQQSDISADQDSKTDNHVGGIEKQLSLEEEIPMIDDADITNDLEFRYSKIITDKDFIETSKEAPVLIKNQSFDDMKKELMADIPELEEFEKDLQNNKREKIIRNIAEDIKKLDEADSIDSAVIDDNVDDLKTKYEKLKEERKKLVSEIHEIKNKMAEIRSQEDDILRELEMEKALIKGEYDSEIAILNIEQKKKVELIEKAKSIEEEIKQLKEKQELRQNEMRERVDIATLKVQRIENDLKDNVATLEELQNAQDILDNETKIFEDLEFQHLEEESELLSNREDVQNDIILLTKKIEAQKTRILTLKSEANNNLTSALDETKILHAEYVRLLNQVEELTSKVQVIEKELKPIVVKLNDIERTQSPDSAFYTDQTRAKSGEFGYSPQSSDSDDIDVKSNFEDHTKQIKEKFNSIDQMSQSMTVDLERRDDSRYSESPSKSSTSSKEKKGFWERNFDSLKRKKKPKSPEKVDIMSQSLNENIFFNNENIEVDAFERFNSLRNSKKKEQQGPVKSNSSSKIPTFAALGKIMKKDSFGKKSKENNIKNDDEVKNRYIKNPKPANVDNKYVKAKSLSPDKGEDSITEEPEMIKVKVTFENNKGIERDNVKSVKILHRKSCGDEPSIKIDAKISDSGKIPSQDDIDRISKVTIDAPILPSDADMNSLGKRTLDSLMEIERKRFEMLEEQGCQVIENEREKISELKRRAQDETKKLWDQKYKEQNRSFEGDHHQSLPSESPQRGEDRTGHVSPMEDSVLDDSFTGNSTLFDESSGLMSSSIEELQVRNSRTESTEDDKRSDDSRPLSHASDFSRDNILSLSNAPRRSRRGIAPYSESQRPLTRYLPVDRDDFDLRRHVESAGHQIELCPYVSVSSTSCRGYLHKLGAKFHAWSKRWFVFDRESKTFVYYWDKSEKKPRGGAYFQVIEEVYLDHGNTSKSPNPQTTFIVKTRQRRYYLMAPSGEAARIWIDVIFTGAQGYTEYLE